MSTTGPVDREAFIKDLRTLTNKYRQALQQVEEMSKELRAIAEKHGMDITTLTRRMRDEKMLSVKGD